MLGDNLELKPPYYATAREILKLALPKRQSKHRFCISIGGESGSGKSVTALCLAQLLREQGIATAVLHQDDYFKLPPETNRLARAQSLANVGVSEVDMDLIAQHIAAFRQGAPQIVKPLVIFHENRIETEIISFEKIEVLILEGTYVSLLPLDCKVFMGRTYKQTHEQRLARGRDIFDDNLNDILSIEHSIIKSHAQMADIYVDSNYAVWGK